jgi:hypothetical protein
VEAGLQRLGAPLEHAGDRLVDARDDQAEDQVDETEAERDLDGGEIELLAPGGGPVDWGR